MHVSQRLVPRQSHSHQHPAHFQVTIKGELEVATLSISAKVLPPPLGAAPAVIPGSNRSTDDGGGDGGGGQQAAVEGAPGQ